MRSAKPCRIRLSPAQAHVVEQLLSDPEAYVVATNLWDFQHIHFSNGKVTYFKKRTREVLVRQQTLVEFEANKYRLRTYNT